MHSQSEFWINLENFAPHMRILGSKENCKEGFVTKYSAVFLVIQIWRVFIDLRFKQKLSHILCVVPLYSW